MQGTLHYGDDTVCQCDHYAPPLRLLRSPGFNAGLARYYLDFGLSGEGIVDHIVMELFDHRTGMLFIDGKPIPIDTDPAITDDLFREDARRTINRHLPRATRTFRYRLQMRMVPLVLMMHFARSIRFCRTEGTCASR